MYLIVSVLVSLMRVTLTRILIVLKAMLRSLLVLLHVSQFTLVELKGTKLIIDNDAGGDDAMAIFLALLYEKHYNGPKLIGLTTGHGNTNEDNVYTNNQRILKVAGRQDVPIYRGSKMSIVTTPPTSTYFGEDGLGDNDYDDSDLKPAQDQDAVTALIEQSKAHEGDLVVITTGTLTNVALAIKLDLDFLTRIAHLYVGAGHIHNDKFPDPGFNAYMDVEAYYSVTQYADPDKVTVVPFSQIRKTCNFSRSWREDVLGAIKTDIMKAQNLYERVSLPKGDAWYALDPAVVAIAIKPDLVKEYKYSNNSIILCGEKRGVNTNILGKKEEANVRVLYSIKTEEYQQFLLDVFSADPNNRMQE